ncbi:MAG: translocation/assembly module TamB [Muribaculum sp.]|nr:translocation/assembly module TamB [Muribaculaceae bacterium]MCM1080572.1 translocation/assembly module TamB [Muribaculum sp.]
MSRIYKIIRFFIVTATVLLLIIPVLTFVLLSLGNVEQRISDVAEKELTNLIGAKVTIASAEIMPFSRVALNNVAVVLPESDTILSVRKLGAGIRLDKFLFKREIVVSYVELLSPSVKLWRDSVSAPLNVAPIIEKLKGDGTYPPKTFNLAINSVVVRKGSFSYDILADTTVCESGRFNKNHISVNNFKADIKLPHIFDKGAHLKVKRLAMGERSGFEVKSLSTIVNINDSSLNVTDLAIATNGSLIQIAEASIWKNLQSGKFDNDSKFVFQLSDESRINVHDLFYFVPVPEQYANILLKPGLDADGTLGDISLNHLTVNSVNNDLLSLAIKGAELRVAVADSLEILVPHFTANISGHQLATHIVDNKKLSTIIDSIGNVSLKAAANIKKNSNSKASVTINTECGGAGFDCDYKGDIFPFSGSGEANFKIDKFNLQKALQHPDLGFATASSFLNYKLDDNKLNAGKMLLEIADFTFKGHNYNGGKLKCNHNRIKTDADLLLTDEYANIAFHAELEHPIRAKKQLKTTAKISNLNPCALNLTGKYEGYSASASVNASAEFDNIDNVDGKFEIYDFAFTDTLGNGVGLNYLTMALYNSHKPQYGLIHSDIFDGNISGNYKLTSLKDAFIRSVSPVMPVLFASNDEDKEKADTDSQYVKLNLDLRSNQTMSRWMSFLKSPIDLVHQVNITASLDGNNKSFKTQIKAPYLLKKDKFIDSTYIAVNIEGTQRKGNIVATTTMPTKQGPTLINLELSAENDSVNVLANWLTDTHRLFAGTINTDISVSKIVSGGLMANTLINPSKIVVNDTVWNVHPARINIIDKYIDVSNFDISGNGQFIKINGAVSENPLDKLILELLDIDLDYIFETLGINNAMFGGRATGKFYASGLFSKEPSLLTPGLHVDNFKYNYSKLGDAEIQSHWDGETKGIVINADITGDDGKHSFVDGAIFPMADSLDIEFKADNLDIGFLKPFMSGFTSQVTGNASGYAHLFGTFKDINLAGDILAKNFRLKLDFTNTYYHTSDSVHIRPGRIEFNNMKLFDDYGNSARLNGWLTHDFFRRPKFEFRITDARKLLFFDVNSQQNPDWFGRVFCNGSATIKGVPGLIDMNIDIATAPNSIFTFALNDNITADEYTFLQFNSRHIADTDLLMAVENPDDASVNRIKKQFFQQKAQQADDAGSVYRINLQLAANPDGEMNLIMDPVSGDKIRAWGNGNMRMEYVSTDDELKIFGTYTLTQGTYNFTLQDIIIKDFTITPGSSITFRGDPLAAQLDIKAAFGLNANLSDLDESFMQDKELNRTNVPVQALLMVNGDMRQPEITFDLGFPTLTQDIYRKVKSIVSTPEMMNRQIIYLLALNRFYTPDYMASTTRGNELMSVASSTISSQLSNILGQLSDKWSISPNFRSSKGDFSDMEVDLALSSHLLNNRLLFNGNFGYRDKSMNNNAFIGDFDLEYLLNRSGNIRLKAYNRYNDQNYFVRSALTTQGVGVVFKRDFDNMFNFLRRKKKTQTKLLPDSVMPLPADSVATDNLIDFKKRTEILPD